MGYVVILLALAVAALIVNQWLLAKDIKHLIAADTALVEILAQSEKRLEDTILAESNATHGMIKHQSISTDSLRTRTCDVERDLRAVVDHNEVTRGQVTILKQEYTDREGSIRMGYRELNDRLIALETAPKPEPRRATEEDPAGGWTTVRARVERGSMVPEGVLNA